MFIGEVVMKMIIALIIVAACISVALPVQAGGISNDLLLSSVWCTFSYNKTTGYSNTTRVHFNKNGTYGKGGRAEGGTSGKYGSYASQNDSSGGGRWKVTKGELYISTGNGQLAPVKTVVKRNSSGYPIILADGVEYIQCK
jgi:hypothetical protein